MRGTKECESGWKTRNRTSLSGHRPVMSCSGPAGASGQPVDNAYTNWAPAVQVIDQSVDLDADYGNWGPGKDVAQSFLPGGDNITGASIKLSSVVGWDTTDVTIELHRRPSRLK